MDFDGDGVAGWYNRDSADSDADMQELTIITCDEDEYDCADDDASKAPGKIEIVDNGIDEDCDYTDATLDLGVDDDTPDDPVDATTTCDGGVAQTTYYQDSDGDGYGGITTLAACSLPTGYVSTSTDCNDADNAIHPGATETLSDAIDQDCNGDVETMDCDDSQKQTYFLDADGDGYRGDTSVSDCMRPAGNYLLATEAESEGSSTLCGTDADNNKYTNPSLKDYGYLVYQSEPTTKTIKETLKTFTAPTVHLHSLPYVEHEYTLAIDNDCDGDVDEDAIRDSSHTVAELSQFITDYKTGHGIYFNVCPDSDGVGQGAFYHYEDKDHDGYGNANIEPTEYACLGQTQEFYVSSEPGDCDDENEYQHPGFAGQDYSNKAGDSAHYAGIDNDCNGIIDDQNSLASNTWSSAVAFNGAKFEITDIIQETIPTTTFASLVSYINTDELKVSGKTITFDHKSKFENSPNYKDERDTTSFGDDHHEDRHYFTGLYFDKAYAQFWHNFVTITFDGDEKSITLGENGGITNKSDFSCEKSTSHCEVDITVDLAQYDSTYDSKNTASGNKLDPIFLKNKAAIAFLRGVSFSGGYAAVEDLNAEVTVKNTDLSKGGTTLTLHIETTHKNTSTVYFKTMIPFTVMVSDSNFVMTDQYEKSNKNDDGFSDESDDTHDVHAFQTKSSALPSRFVTEDTLQCSNESQDEEFCKEQATRQVASLLYSWGYDWSTAQDVTRIKAMSYLSGWINNGSQSYEAKIKTKGVGYNLSTGEIKNPDRMGAFLVICANSTVCQTKFTYRDKTSEGSQIQNFEISFD